MSDLLVCRIRTPMRAFQYLGQPAADLPDWVHCKVLYHTKEGLCIRRRTGPQWIYLNEWLVSHPNELDLRWYTDRAFLNELEQYS